MNEDESTLDVQEARIAQLPASLSDDYRKKMGELLDLSDEQKDRIKTWLKKHITDWNADTKDLHERLQDDNDLVEGIIMETDFPWVGCSNVHIPVTEIYMDGACSTEERSILGAGMIWVAETEDDDLRGITAQIEEMMNYNARNKWNVERSLPGILWTTNRDGLGVAQVPYVEEYEKCRDILVITSQDEFVGEFSTPEESGISPEQYNELLSLCANATDQDPVEIPITFERPVYIGPKVEIVELVDFVTIPAWVQDIKDQRCRGYGKRYPSHIESIREKAENDVFYQDAAERVINKGKPSEYSSYVQAKDEIIGIKRTDPKDERQLFELVIKGRLIEGGEIEKLLVTYSLEADELLQVIDYVYRVDFYALFRVDERPNQLVGKSTPAKTRDLNDLIDTSVNQEINIRTISTVPIFKAKKDMKGDLDAELQQNKIRPGMILWLSDFDSVDQFKVQPTDLGENAQLQERMMRVLDMYIGMPASLFAGGVPAGDPTAPGNKTAALIAQGNLRMEHPISFLRYGMADLGNICLSHLYQFGPAFLDYQSEEKGPDGSITKKAGSIHKKYLRKNINLRMNAVSVVDNPDAEMNKQFQLHTILMTTQEYASNPELQNEVLRDALQKGRVSGRDRYLPSSEAIHSKLVALQAQAMQQIVQQKQMEQEAAAKAAIAQRLAEAKQNLNIHDTAKKVAESNLGINGSPA